LVRSKISDLVVVAADESGRRPITCLKIAPQRATGRDRCLRYSTVVRASNKYDAGGRAPVSAGGSRNDRDAREQAIVRAFRAGHK
jgi:hypothetical protein